MTPLEIILMVIRGIARLTANPALGGGGIGAQRSAELMSMLATLIEGGSETAQALKAFAAEIQALVDSNGEPSRGQWETMQARDAAARAALEANKAGLTATKAAPSPFTVS
jgi:hypothetical protein